MEQRTEELKQKNAELEKLYKQLQGSFVNTIKVFTGLVELWNPAIGNHGRRVASLCRKLASQMRMDEGELNNIELAGLLHDIGKIGLPDEVLSKDSGSLSAGERRLLHQHPIIGQAALQVVDDLETFGVLVRHHHELWNGMGYPDRLRGEGIPIGSRIIAMADAFDNLRKQGSVKPADFIRYQLSLGANAAFDPNVILALKDIVEEWTAGAHPVEVVVHVRELREGMVLAEDICTSTGILLIPKGETLKKSYLERLVLYERQKLIRSTVHVYK